MTKVIAYVGVFVCGFLCCALILQWSVISNGAFNPVSGIANARASMGQQSIKDALNRTPPSRRSSLYSRPSVSDAAAHIEPAVVNIDIEGRGPTDDLLRLLQPQSSAEQLFEGSGSGIILSSDGYVVTNNHVVAPVTEKGAKGKITVRLDSGREFKNVKVVGRDTQTDLALLRIVGAKNLPTAELGDSETLRVGDWAIAVGNPLGFNSTVTLGIVSALNRRNFGGEGGDALDRVIQTDAAINPGNSGGALADIDGRVVGINTAIASSTGGSVGIGFAIPINSVKRIVRDLVEHGKVLRPYLGVMYLPVADVERKSLPRGVTLPADNKGAVILSERGEMPAVAPNSPAAKAGLKEFDVIREVDGRAVTHSRLVKETVQARKVGEKIPMKIWRNGTTRTVTVTLEAMPDSYGKAAARRRRFSPNQMPFFAPR